MPIFTKLLDTKIVANNSWGLSISFDAILSVLELLSFSFKISAGLSAKKATSDPDINAEQTNNTKVSVKPIAEEIVNWKKVILRLVNTTHWEKGSGSKII